MQFLLVIMIETENMKLEITDTPEHWGYYIQLNQGCKMMAA